MLFKSEFNSFILVVAFIHIAIILIVSLNEAEAKRIPRTRTRDPNRTLTIVDKKTDLLFQVLDAAPENDKFDPVSCEPIHLKMPNFTAPGRRISEIKCLEHLWKMRFYDEIFVKLIQCGTDFDYSISVIFGGEDATPGEYPHMGAVGWKAINGTWIFKCGSTLISDRFMITAAHCSRTTRDDMTVVDPEPKIVRLGETNILDKNKDGKPPVDIYIKRFIIHPHYRSPRKYFDIALIELETPVTFTILSHPACIWTDNLQEVYGRAALTGWGIVEAGSNEAHPKLQVAKVDVVSPIQCERMLRSRRNRNWRGLVMHQMCAGHMPGGVDSCRGDSGGPLQMAIDIPEYTDWKIHFIVGVTSFGYGCGLPNTPSVYTRVSRFLDWIEDIVWGLETSATGREHMSESHFHTNRYI